MAEAVASIVIGGLNLLGNLVIQNAKLLQGVGGQVELAQKELLLMQSFLRDADARQEDDEVVRFWVNEVREAAYDLEDAVEAFVLKVATRRGGSMRIVLKRFACICNEGVDRYQIGSEIESIKTKLSNLGLAMRSYDNNQLRGSEGASSSARQREHRLTYAHVSDDHGVVGLGDAIETLTTRLVDEKGGCRIVSIWGMGGSGKTTLAKQVYNHEKVNKYFDCFAWVCVSQQFEGTTIMREILQQLIGASDEEREKYANLNSNQIATTLHDYQRDRKCLVVLDDIWTLDGWNSLKGGFPVATNSRIILTTRNEELTSLAMNHGLSYESQPLSVDDAWSLFRMIAFSEIDETDSNRSRKEALGMDMLGYCAGLPQAIIVLAGLLSRKHTVGEWETVSPNVNVHIGRGTDLDREYNGQRYGGTLWVLTLSYESLPYRLKLCFLYLSHFPENYEISVKQLIYLWMAEGFISSTSSETLEEVSYCCLSELVGRCMIEVGQIGLNGKIKTCRLHNLMRDLCVQRAKDENLFHFASMGTRTNGTQVGRVRRLAIYLDKEVDQLVPNTGDGHVRSLLYFSPADFPQIWKERDIWSVFNDFKLLRVLKLEDMRGLRKLPRTIENLVHLRFLSLKKSGINHLPSSLANLVCLQILDLRYSSSEMIEIPNMFQKMEQLRHLYLPWTNKTVQGQLALGNLQTLVNVEWGGFDLNSLTNLRKLYINETTSESDPWKNMEEILKSRSNLHSLSVVSGPSWDIVSKFPFVYKLRLEGSIEKLPEGLSSFPNLIKLKLSGTNLMQDQKEILEGLPHLRALYLYGKIFSSLPEDTLVCTNGAFPDIEFLCLEKLTGIRELKVERGAMPLLRRLRIEYCESLEAVPEGLQHVANLNELTVKFMPTKFCDRLGKQGEDFRKIGHVPSVIITGTEFRDEVDIKRAERASRRT